MIVWDQRTAHGSAPNDSANPRYAQFFKVFEALPLDQERAIARAEVLAQKIRDIGAENEVTELGKKMFGWKPW